jgi:hypothetical protein
MGGGVERRVEGRLAALSRVRGGSQAGVLVGVVRSWSWRAADQVGWAGPGGRGVGGRSCRGVAVRRAAPVVLNRARSLPRLPCRARSPPRAAWASPTAPLRRCASSEVPAEALRDGLLTWRRAPPDGVSALRAEENKEESPGMPPGGCSGEGGGVGGQRPSAARHARSCTPTLGPARRARPTDRRHPLRPLAGSPARDGSGSGRSCAAAARALLAYAARMGPLFVDLHARMHAAVVCEATRMLEEAWLHAGSTAQASGRPVAREGVAGLLAQALGPLAAALEAVGAQHGSGVHGVGRGQQQLTVAAASAGPVGRGQQQLTRG